ncbi:hypothetical protein YC2023_033614 [Brassica napus]
MCTSGPSLTLLSYLNALSHKLDESSGYGKRRKVNNTLLSRLPLIGEALNCGTIFSPLDLCILKRIQWVGTKVSTMNPYQKRVCINCSSSTLVPLPQRTPSINCTEILVSFSGLMNSQKALY